MSAVKHIDVVLGRVMYHKVADWSTSGIPYLIAATDQGVIKGNMYKPVQGESYRLYGDWDYDQQRGQNFFAFYSFEILMSRTVDGVLDYLDRYVPAFGRARARQFVDLYGVDAVNVLRDDPSKILEIKGVPPTAVEQIERHFSEQNDFRPEDYANLYSLLVDYRPPKSVVEAILADWGSSAVDVIKENPYILMGYPGLGWKTVDKIATEKIKYNKKGINRFKAAVMECLKRVEDEGHTYVERRFLDVKLQEIVGAGPVDAAIDALAEEDKVDVERTPDGKVNIALVGTAKAERNAAALLRKLVESNSGVHFSYPTAGLEGEQVEAVEFLNAHPVAVLAGPPGTGKTFTSTNIIRSHIEHGRTVKVNAPTGRAAKRAAEVLASWGIYADAETIHKTLGSVGSLDDVGVPEEHAKFNRGRSSREFAHAKGLFIEADDAFGDEWSMVGIRLFERYLRALAPGTRFLATGDPHQLQSVDCGAVLRDLIAGGVPTAMLTQPRRNSGAIVRACHAIKDGRMPTPSGGLEDLDPAAGKNWVHIEEPDVAKIPDLVVWLHTQTQRDAFNDFQVISAENKRIPIGCANLNRLLSAHFNPRNHTGAREEEEKPRYAVLDKVVRDKNGKVWELVDWSLDDEFASEGEVQTATIGGRVYAIQKTPVVNGDIGQIVAMDVRFKGSKYILVRFKNPNRLCMLPAGDPKISLAYCVTCHKFQGCGSPVVVLPVHNSYFWDSRTDDGLWCRELVYTMFSRAEEVLITVGSLESIRTAIGRKTIDKRKTRLARYIREEFAKIAA